MTRHWPWVFLALPLLWLFAPLIVSDHGCILTAAFPRLLGIHFDYDCDSAGFIKDALNLPHFPESYNSQRSPLYVIALGLLALVMHPYIAGLVLNWLMLAAAFWMAKELAPRNLLPPIFAAIATTDFAHGWQFVVHSTYANLLVPLGVVYFFARKSSVWWASAALGIYPAVGIWLPARWLGDRTWRNAAWACAAVAPYLAWMAVVHYVAGVNSISPGYNQFSWLWQPHPDVWGHFEDFASVLWLSFARMPVFVMMGLILISPGAVERYMNPFPAKDRVLTGCLVALGMVLGFVMLCGYFAPRLVTGLDVALIIALARLWPKPGPMWFVAAVQVAWGFAFPAVSFS